MRLRRLDLTRFGHFTDRQIDLGPTSPGGSDFHIIYGPNEAGKSTLMEAYLRLIYGFPVRDTYGFKHPLPSLQVGGVVEVNGVGTELMRVKKPANSLLDRNSDVVPETILQSLLGGVTEGDYRKLFCLDDATIEAGGEEITNSKGDIGKLLFSAAAGIGNLTGVLDQVGGRADQFYKKGASKTTYAGLKRDLDTVINEIKTQDIPAAQYRHLRTALDTAKAAEAAARAAKDALERRITHLSAIIAAHLVAADLRQAEADLHPIAHYPAAIDIDLETLVAMERDRARYEVVRDQQTALIADAEAQRSALILHTDILALRDQITSLDTMREDRSTLRGRMEGATADLPIRTADRTAALAEMRIKLLDMGIDPGNDPTRFVLLDHQLRVLEQALRDLTDAETALSLAADEVRKATRDQHSSAAQRSLAEAAVTVGPEIEDVLIRFDAAQCVEDHRTAQQQRDLVQATSAERLRDLTRGKVNFADLPAVTLTVAQADDLVTAILRSEQDREASDHARGQAADKLKRATARLAQLSATPNLVTDEIATARRAERQDRWTIHRATLDAATAEAFADAMGRDDAATALRQEQTRQIADHQQARLAVTEVEFDMSDATARLEAANATLAALDLTRQTYLGAIGLPANLTAADLAGWMRQHDAARQAANHVQTVLDSTQRARDAADRLCAALSGLPGMDPTADLDSLFRVAKARLDARKAQLAAVALARAAADKDAVALSGRMSIVAEAQTAHDKAATAWQTAAQTALPDDITVTSLRDALPRLRTLREVNETISGLTRQIDGMIRDRDSFVARIAPLAKVVGMQPDDPPLDIYMGLSQTLTVGDKAQAEWDRLTASIATAKAERDAATAAIATQDRQLRSIVQTFDPAIPTATLSDLRNAVRTGQTAIGLRTSIATLNTTLCTRLGVPNRAEADILLDTQPLDLAEADFNGLTTDIRLAEKAVETAIEARTTAQGALDRVQGDADIATRVARQRTIEVEMEDGTLRYLEDRFAHMLAERAIRRYRDTHRNGMLLATEDAFKTLTNGAYGKLDTSTEELLAVHIPTNGSVRAREMSKGTRFQLYLALRAAAYDQMAANGTILPFFCDDIFETFDESRTTAACGLMQQIGQRGQAIYLTHHKHVVTIAQQLCGDAVRVHMLGE